MKKLIKDALIYCSFIPLLLHVIVLYFNILFCADGGGKIILDIEHYKRRKHIKYNTLFTFVYLFLIFPEFRNIFFSELERFGDSFCFGFLHYLLYIFGLHQIILVADYI